MRAATKTSAIGALAALFLASALPGACTYDPKIPSGKIICDPDGGRCPAGFTCVAVAGSGFCTSTATPATDATADSTAPVADAGADSSGDAPPAPDAAPGADAPDAPPADAMPDLRISEPLPPASSVPDGGCLAPGRGPDMVHAATFCIDGTEVTNKQYLAFLEEADPAKQPAGCATTNLSFVPLNVEAPWPPVGRENHPVVNVDWCDAAAFCQWSGKHLCGLVGSGMLDPKQAALPALSQWASACTRVGTWKLPYGPDVKPGLCNVGQPNRPLHIVPVSSMPGCQGGYDKLYDMVGNVEEWLDSCRVDPAKGEVCAVIGGNYFDGESVSDCGRLYEEKKLLAQYYRGFRCCWP